MSDNNSENCVWERPSHLESQATQRLQRILIFTILILDNKMFLSSFVHLFSFSEIYSSLCSPTVDFIYLNLVHKHNKQIDYSKASFRLFVSVIFVAALFKYGTRGQPNFSSHLAFHHFPAELCLCDNEDVVRELQKIHSRQFYSE